MYGPKDDEPELWVGGVAYRCGEPWRERANGIDG